MLEMGRMFLPINNNWTRFIHEAERTYESINSDIQHVLMQIANEACHQAIDQKYYNLENKKILFFFNEILFLLDIKMILGYGILIGVHNQCVFLNHQKLNHRR
jgi:hypothetical protein